MRDRLVPPNGPALDRSLFICLLKYLNPMKRKLTLPAVLAMLALIVSACIPSEVEGQNLPLDLEVESGSVTQTTADGSIISSMCTYKVGYFPSGEDEVYTSVILEGPDHIYTTYMEEVVGGSARASVPVEKPESCLDWMVIGLHVEANSDEYKGYVVADYECKPIKGSNASECKRKVDRTYNAQEGTQAKRRI